MSGSWFGRGRVGRLAVYGGCGVVVVLLIFLYRAATSEMARLRDLHVQCARQKEALAAQLHVILEYKVRLEMSLGEEKSSNAVLKQELQQRVSKEKSLRDKDSIEAMQRFNSLQQTYKLLQTEHQDLQEECKKQEKQALEDTNRLESTLRELRGRIQQAKKDKDRAYEHLKNKFLEIENDKTKLEDKYNHMVKNNERTASTIEHLKMKVIQLEQELKKPSHRTISPGPSIAGPQTSQETKQQMKVEVADSVGQPVVSSQQQQSTVATSSMKSIPVMKVETSTPASNGSPASTVIDKSLPIARPALKAKLPVGVPPIPVMIDRESIENEKQVENTKKKEPSQKKDIASKEKKPENENLGPPFPAAPGRRVDEQLPDRRGNGWFNVGPGVQEIGDEPNHPRLPGLDDGGDQNVEAAHEQYEDYGKEPQQKNGDLLLVEEEDEGEDEDDQPDYVQNLKQEKHG